jgi:hypothetical protein
MAVNLAFIWPVRWIKPLGKLDARRQKMRKLCAVAVIAALLAMPAVAGERTALLDRLRDMTPVDHVGSAAAWALWDCSEAAAKALGERKEPGVLEADWVPSHARPTIEEEAASALASCPDELARAQGVLAAPELAEIKASIKRINVETIRWERDERARLRRE